MDGSEFIQFASRLAVVANNGPAAYRSAISRAYYGAFHAAVKVLNDLNFYCTKNGNEHIWVRDFFANSSVDVGEEISQKLGNLAESRKRADYNLARQDVETQQNATLAVQRADAIKTSVAACLADAQTHAALGAGFQAYRAKTRR